MFVLLSAHKFRSPGSVAQVGELILSLLVSCAQVLISDRQLEVELTEDLPNMVNRYIRDGDNPDLSAERQHCAFDTDALAAVLCGGKDVFQRRQRVTEFVERTPALRQLSSDTTYGSKMDWTRQAWHNEAVMRRHLHQAVPDVDDRDTHEHFKK